MRRSLALASVFVAALNASASVAKAETHSKYLVIPYSETNSAGTECNNAAAREQGNIAVREYAAGNVDDAYKYAGSAWMHVGSCRNVKTEDHRGAGDAMFVIAVFTLQRGGNQHAANADAGIAIAEYQFCVQYPKIPADVGYCKSMLAKIDSMSK